MIECQIKSRYGIHQALSIFIFGGHCSGKALLDIKGFLSFAVAAKVPPHTGLLSVLLLTLCVIIGNCRKSSQKHRLKCLEVILFILPKWKMSYNEVWNKNKTMKFDLLIVGYVMNILCS